MSSAFGFHEGEHEVLIATEFQGLATNTSLHLWKAVFANYAGALHLVDTVVVYLAYPVTQ